MNSFDVLLIGHLIGDFSLQTNWMAMNKTNSWLALATHATVYTFAVTIAAKLFDVNLSIWGVLLIFISHLILDRRTVVKWWAEVVTGTTQQDLKWLNIVHDQIFHLLILVTTLYI